MANRERRLHDLTYGEIADLLRELEEERDMWRAKAEGRDHAVEPKPSIVESVEFVVDMMNSGSANPDHVYPRGNRYHGD